MTRDDVVRKPALILASASPRRKALLEAAGYPIEVDPSDIDEPAPSAGEDLEPYVSLLAWRKAAAVAGRRASGLVIAADTACAVGGEILNKPVDRADAERMIRLQEGRDTSVSTGICLHCTGRAVWLGAVETSVVRFRPLSDIERTAYLDSARWAGKAGAYGLQDDDPWIKVVAGTWSNVVGLPMERLASLLNEFPRLTDTT